MCPWFDSWRYHKAETQLPKGFPLIFTSLSKRVVTKIDNVNDNVTAMTNLLFGCTCTELWVSPENWRESTSKKNLLNGYFQYYFFDPAFKDKYPKGKPCREKFKKKLKGFDTLVEMKAAISFLTDEIEAKISKGYNPITETYMLLPEKPKKDKLHKDLPCVDAIELAWTKILESADEDVKKPFDDVRIAKNRFIKGLKELHFDNILIKDLKTYHAKEVIAHVKITIGYYNKFLSYMSKIFTELIEYDCIEVNPFKMFKKKKNRQKIREVLTEQEFVHIMTYLKTANYEFYRYAMIFHYSGARTTELLSVQKKHVNIKTQEYRVWILKGDRYVEETKVIMPDALPLWKEVFALCKTKEDYLFAKGLVPGKDKMDPEQISRRWNRWVKTNYNNLFDKNITADFYALKHLFLDKLDALQNNAAQDVNLAQVHASHRSPAITNSVYLTGKKKREREVLKNISLK